MNSNNSTQQNSYLKTLLDPFTTGDINIPDLDMSRSTLKSVVINFDMDIPSTGLLIVYLPHSYRSVVKLFLYNEPTQGYVWWRDLDFDEDLTESYEAFRLVSSGLSTISNSISAGNFTIQGTINGVQHQSLPDLSTLTWNRLTSYKYDNVNVVSALPASVGVTTVANPTGRARFRSGVTNSVTGVVDILQLDYTRENDTGEFPPWVRAPPDNTYMSATVDNGFLPPNLWGKLRFDVSLTQVSPAGTTIVWVIWFKYRVMSASGVPSEESSIRSAYLVGGSTARTTSFSGSVTVPASLYEIEITSSTVGPVLQEAYCRVTSEEYYLTGENGPGALIAYEGIIANNQRIGISVKSNYEVIPNSALIRNVPIRPGMSENPMEMELAETFFGLASHMGIKTIAPSPDYSAFLRSQRFMQILDNAYLAEASGFSDFFMKVWNSIKPFIRSAAPLAGEAMLGPAGGLIGTGVSQLLGNSSAYNDDEIQAQINRGYSGSKPYSGLMNPNIGSRSGNNARASAFRMPLGRASGYDDFPGMWGKIKPLYGSLDLVETGGFDSSEDTQSMLDFVTACCGTNSQDNSGEASFIGDGDWWRADQSVFEPVSVPAPEGAQHRCFTKTYFPNKESTMRSKMWAQKGKTDQIDYARNTFPIVQGDKVQPGVVEFSSTPFEVVAGMEVLYHSEDDYGMLLYVNCPMLNMDSVRAVVLAYRSCLHARLEAGLEVKRLAYVAVTSFIGLQGASLGAAAYASMSGKSLPCLITGAVAGGIFFQPSDVETKAKGVANMGYKLATVTDADRLAADPEARAAYARLCMGVVTTNRLYSIKGGDGDLTLLMQQFVEPKPVAVSERVSLEPKRVMGPAFQKAENSSTTVPDWDWSRWGESVLNKQQLYKTEQKDGKAVVQSWVNRANDQSLPTIARSKAIAKIDGLARLLDQMTATEKKKMDNRANNSKRKVKKAGPPSVKPEARALPSVAEIEMDIPPDPTEEAFINMGVGGELSANELAALEALDSLL